MCLRFFVWEGCSALIFSMLGEGILQIRIYAMYAGNKRLLSAMLAIFMVCSALSAGLIWRSLSTLPFDDVIALSIPLDVFCWAGIDPPNLYAFWIPTMVFESMLCISVFLPGFWEVKDVGNLSRFIHGKSLMKILVRDSIIYFLGIFGAAIISLLASRIANGKYLEGVVSFSVALTCTLGSRLILNIRSAHKTEEIDTGVDITMILASMNCRPGHSIPRTFDLEHH